MGDNKYIGIFLDGIDQGKLVKNDENELSKFRANIANAIKGILRGDPKEKRKIILALKEGLFELITQIPVVTPIVTAMLQVITGEDTSSKLDDLSSKMDSMIELQKQTLTEIADLKNLQKQTINLQRQTIKEIHKLSEKISSRK